MTDFQFDSLGAFLSMGGDAFFVWGAYAIFAICMAWQVIQPILQHRKVVRLIRARMQRDKQQSSDRN
jgi:heme exporter protein CcmD